MGKRLFIKLVIIGIILVFINSCTFLENENTQDLNKNIYTGVNNSVQIIKGEKYILSDDSKINKLMDLDLEKSLEEELKNFNETNGRDLTNLISLQRIYKDKGEYKKALSYGNMAFAIIDEGFEISNKALKGLVEDYVESLIFIGENNQALKIINKYNDRVDLFFYQGLVYYKMGNYKKSISYFNMLKKTDLRYDIGMYLKAKIYLLLKKYDKSEEVFASNYCNLENGKLGEIYCKYFYYKGLKDFYKATGDSKNYEKYNNIFNKYVEEIHNGKQFTKNGELISTEVIDANILNSKYE